MKTVLRLMYYLIFEYNFIRIKIKFYKLTILTDFQFTVFQ